LRHAINHKSQIQSPNEWRTYQTKAITLEEEHDLETKEISKALKYSKEELLNKINEKVNSDVIYSEIKRYHRSPYVIALALKEADGICKLCNKKSPFKNKKNEDYLEVHHVIPLSKKGLDNIDNVAALCPNCHREIHHGLNKNELIRKLL